jgi:hypothetical protein
MEDEDVLNVRGGLERSPQSTPHPQRLLRRVCLLCLHPDLTEVSLSSRVWRPLLVRILGGVLAGLLTPPLSGVRLAR